MKKPLSVFLGGSVAGLDGDLGKVADFYFSDRDWSLRFLVCELSPELGGDQVLVPASLFRPKDWDIPVFPVFLKLEQILACPRLGKVLPVSLQKALTYPELEANTEFIAPASWGNERHDDPHLRSFIIVRGYRIASFGKLLGRVSDFVVDDQDWTIPYMIAKIGKWGRRQLHLVPPSWARSIDWDQGLFLSKTSNPEWLLAPEFSRWKTHLIAAQGKAEAPRKSRTQWCVPQKMEQL